MSPYGKRLAEAMRHAGLDPENSQSELARLVDIKQSSINYLLNKAKGSSYTAEIADKLGVNPLWLAKGVGQMVADKNGKSGEASPKTTDVNHSSTPNGQAFPRSGVASATMEHSGNDGETDSMAQEESDLVRLFRSMDLKHRNRLLELAEDLSLASQALARPFEKRRA